MPTPTESFLIDFTRDVYFVHKDLKPTTRDDYLTQIRLFNQSLRFRQAERDERLRDATLAELTDDNLAYAMSWQRQRGGTASTANHLFRVVRAVWNLAYDQEVLLRQSRVKKYAEPKRTPSCWSIPEMELIVSAALQFPGRIGDVPAGIWLAAWFSFIYATGARLNVTLKLPTANFDPRRGEVLLPFEHQKQTADQLHKIHDHAVEAVLRLRSDERGLPLLFGDWTMGKKPLNNRLRDVIVAAGLRPNREAVTRRDLTHKVRKTFGTHVTAAAGIETARQLLGHASTNTTLVYVDPKYVEAPSARDVLPELSRTERVLRLHRPEAG